jgi:hypothetical protein
MRAAVGRLNEEGSYYALYCSLEQLREITDEDKAMSIIMDSLDETLYNFKVDALKRVAGNGGFLADLTNRPGFNSAPVRVFLRTLCERLDKDLVVFFDEADCLEERVLLSFLSQLRVGYVERDNVLFPRSMALIGMRNIRDYKAKIRSDSDSLGSASPFNIITEALTLTNFTRDEVQTLYAQHTEATGQVFENEAVDKAWYWTEGQPWLVNALAREVVEKILAHDYDQAITIGHINEATDNLMKRRDTHIDSLLARLHEPRVRRFIEPMLAAYAYDSDALGSDKGAESYHDDLQYCFDLGLIKRDGRLRPANPIYANVIVRFLSENIRERLPEEISGKWMDATTIDMTGLLKAFQKFWAQRAERTLKGFLYKEAGPHNLLMAYLQKVVNGGAMVIEQYALGLGYVDIAVQYAGRYYPIELKLKDNERSRAKSHEQLLRYMDSLQAKEGWLIIFDRKSSRRWFKKLTWKTSELPGGLTIHEVGC